MGGDDDGAGGGGGGASFLSMAGNGGRPRHKSGSVGAAETNGGACHGLGGPGDKDSPDKDVDGDFNGSDQHLRMGNRRLLPSSSSGSINPDTSIASGGHASESQVSHHGL